MQIDNFISKAWKGFISLLYPSSCVGCGREGSWLCRECLDNLAVYDSGLCPICQKPSSNYLLCARCKLNKLYTRVIIRGKYQSRALQGLIKGIKYHYNLDLQESLNALIEKALSEIEITRGLILVPIPLHRKRRRERGFNQAELIALALSREYGIPINDQLIARKRNNKAQASLNREERLKNCHGVFELKAGQSCYKDKILILVDDVFTTGSTMQACAEELAKIKPREIWGFALAHD